jgi:pyridoxine 5-phosphate synthase
VWWRITPEREAWKINPCIAKCKDVAKCVGPRAKHSRSISGSFAYFEAFFAERVPVKDLDNVFKLPIVGRIPAEMTSLLINIDHVATLRNARRELIPDPVDVALACEKAGADGIVFHLREDRRHIKDADVLRLKEHVTTKLDFECSLARDVIDLCCEVKPELATLVPERREEVTTEGGIDAVGSQRLISITVEKLFAAGIGEVALFIDPVASQIEAAASTGANAIELHTGEYANARSEVEAKQCLKALAIAAQQAHDLGMRVHAGHGLDYDNYLAFRENIPHLAEVSIGFAIIARGIMVGIKEAVGEMKKLVNG